MSADPYIRVDGLAVSYDGHTEAVADIDLNVDKGEFVAILGPSGSGKSTLLQVLSGLLAPLRGHAEIGGQPVDGTPAGLPPIGYVFQDHRLLPWRTVGQNLELVLAAADVPRSEWDDRIDRYLRMLQIERFRDTWPMRMSGGQRQRVSIARALALDPAVVLMDEPFSTLDEVTGRLMRQQLLDVWEANPQTIVFVTHSIREAFFLADRIVVLTQGPATVLKEVVVDLPRPRRYESPELTARESALVDEVMEPWGYASSASTESPS